MKRTSSLHSLYLCFMLITTNLFFIACGKSVYSQFGEGDPGAEATRALEEDNPDKAILILESAIESDPANYELISLLASAKAQKAGVDTVALILNLAGGNEDGSDSESSNEIVGLFSVMPEYDPSITALLAEAVELITNIPGSQTIAADQFKLSLFYTAFMTVRTKQIDSDGDGSLSQEELANLDQETALAIIQDILTAEDALNGYSADDGTEAAADGIAAISAAIAAEEGEDSTEQLRNYLGYEGEAALEYW